MDVEELLKRSVEANASDIFIIPGLPITFKVGGRQIRLEDNGKLMPQQTEELIRESKTYQMESAIQAGAAQGMRAVDSSLLEMVKDGIISKDTALTYCINYEAMSRKLK